MHYLSNDEQSAKYHYVIYPHFTMAQTKISTIGSISDQKRKTDNNIKITQK